MKNKFLLIIGILFLVCISYYFVLLQNRNPVPGIEAEVSYKKPILGFELEVPTGYEKIVEVAETQINMNYVVSVRKIGDAGEEIKTQDGICAHCTFQLQIIRNFVGGINSAKFQTPGEWALNEEKMGVSLTKETLGGKDAYKSVSKTTPIETYYYVFLNRNDYYDFYVIKVNQSDIANKILSSLKFTFLN